MQGYLGIHLVFALVFFLTFGAYCVLLAFAFKNNSEKFPPEMQTKITIIFWLSLWVIFCVLALFITPFFDHYPDQIFWSAIAEWVTVISYCNYFVVVSMVNNYYNTVHDEGYDLRKLQL